MFVSGIISIWSGSIATIPSGWVICDGNNGTPDLRNKFVIGAGGGFVVDETGGATTHLHPVTGDGHMHTLTAGAQVGAGAAFNADTDVDAVTGLTNPVSSFPPFHALAYIMKT